MIIAYRTARKAQYFMYIHTHPTEAVDTTVIHTHSHTAEGSRHNWGIPPALLDRMQQEE